MRVSVEMTIFAFVTGSLPRRALSLVYDWLDLHKDELLQNWIRLQQFESPVKIEPLK